MHYFFQGLSLLTTKGLRRFVLIPLSINLLLFAAAFGQEQPLVANTSEKARAQNRRVEMAPVPKTSNATAPRTPKATPP